MKNFLDRLVSSNEFNIEKASLKNNIEADNISKIFYLVDDYIIIDVFEDKWIAKILISEMNISYEKQFYFYNSRKLLKNTFGDKVSGNGNDIIIKTKNIDVLKQSFILWLSYLRFPVLDKDVKKFNDTRLILSRLGWRRDAELSTFFLPYSLKENKIKAFTPLGKVLFDNDEFVPILNRDVSIIRYPDTINIDFNEEIKSTIMESNFLWLEGKELYSVVRGNRKNNASIILTMKNTLKIFQQCYETPFRIINNDNWGDIRKPLFNTMPNGSKNNDYII